MIKYTLLASLMLSAAGVANAQSAFPDRPITMIVPFAAGGPTDTIARLVAESMTKTLGQALVVENAGGAGSTVGAARAARSDPDGYTLLVNHVAQASMGALYPKLAFDPDAAFDGIGLVSDAASVLVTREDLEATDAASLLDYIRTNKDAVTYGHAGVGSASHLCGMLLMDALDVQMTTVPYKGTGPAMTDLLGGQIDMMCEQATNAISQVKAEKIRADAVTTQERLAALPDLPTLSESGLDGFQFSVWHGLYAPAGTPKEIIDQLSDALQVALADPTVVERFAQLATSPATQEQATPEALDAKLAAEIAKWKPIIEGAGIFAE